MIWNARICNFLNAGFCQDNFSFCCNMSLWADSIAAEPIRWILSVNMLYFIRMNLFDSNLSKAGNVYFLYAAFQSSILPI